MPVISLSAVQPANMFFMVAANGIAVQPAMPEETFSSLLAFSNMPSSDTANCMEAEEPSKSTRLV